MIFKWLFIAGCTEATSDKLGEPGIVDVPAETCVESAKGEFPVDVEWISFDGQSNELFSLSDSALSDSWEGLYGTYDLNTVEFGGANGFQMQRPGTVVGAQVKWSNLPAEEAAVDLTLWPDFGSDGYIWDKENPYGVETRCLNSTQDGEWVDYLFSEPVRINQPLHIFAGYHRDEREEGSVAIQPEIMLENYQQDGEPFYSGAFFYGVDDEQYFLGMASSWYTWQIRLAVIYDDEIAPEQKPFVLDAALSVSSRVAWGDYDNDGDDDLMTNGPVLWQNNGDGSFTDVTEESIFADVGSNGGVWGDYDNDGCLDYFGQSTVDLLLRNNCNEDGGGYVFVDETVSSGIHDIQDERDCDGDGLPEPSPTEGVAWFDLDSDGFLDLYLANYECSSEYDFFHNYNDKLWRNNGDGSFSDWTERSNVPSFNNAGRGVTTGDYDQDGDTDIFISNYRLDANYFLRNDGEEGLKDISGNNGTKGEYVVGAYGHTIGSVFGDIDNDGDFDMVQANLAHPFYYWFSDKTMVLVNDGAGIFTDEAMDRGIYYRETHSNPTLFDADNDGDLDLFITSVYSSRDSDFYINDGFGHFSLRNYESGLTVRNGWGAASSDFDNDGDVDIIAYDLYRNELSAGAWVQVRVIGGASGGPADGWTDWSGMSNVSGIGAVVTLVTNQGIQLRQISGGSGTGVQDSFVQHFGLKEGDEIEEIQILFPGGNEVIVNDVQSNQRIWIHEDGSQRVGFGFPIDLLPIVTQ